MSDDSKSLHRALETIQSKMKESGNVVELRRKLKDERKNNVELTEEIAKLRTEVEMMSRSRRADEDNDMAERVQRELNLSARLDQQLLNVVDSEPEDALNRCTDLKQANKEIVEINRLKEDLEIEREMLKSQVRTDSWYSFSGLSLWQGWSGSNRMVSINDLDRDWNQMIFVI